MVKLRSLIPFLLLTSCAVPKFGTDWNNIIKAHDLNVINLQDQACSKALNYSLNYFRSIGHPIRLTHDADKVLICMRPLPLYVEVLSLANPKGATYANAAWVTVSGRERDKTIMIHELKHLLLEETHGVELLPIVGF